MADEYKAVLTGGLSLKGGLFKSKKKWVSSCLPYFSRQKRCLGTAPGSSFVHYSTVLSLKPRLPNRVFSAFRWLTREKQTTLAWRTNNVSSTATRWGIGGYNSWYRLTMVGDFELFSFLRTVKGRLLYALGVTRVSAFLFQALALCWVCNMVRPAYFLKACLGYYGQYSEYRQLVVVKDVCSFG